MMLSAPKAISVRLCATMPEPIATAASISIQPSVREVLGRRAGLHSSGDDGVQLGTHQLCNQRRHCGAGIVDRSDLGIDAADMAGEEFSGKSASPGERDARRGWAG